MMKATIVEAVNDALHAEMARDDRTLVFGEDVARSGGVFRATDGLLDAFGEKRVRDMPLSEIAIVGAAVGLATHGYRPVAEIQFSGFLPPAFDQLVSNASRIRWRTRGRPRWSSGRRTARAFGRSNTTPRASKPPTRTSRG
jgi:pyruvate dehydrogenase E1 component beta subunit